MGRTFATPSDLHPGEVWAGGGIAAEVEGCETAGFAAGRAGKAVSGPM